MNCTVNLDMWQGFVSAQSTVSLVLKLIFLKCHDNTLGDIFQLVMHVGKRSCFVCNFLNKFLYLGIKARSIQNGFSDIHCPYFAMAIT